MTISKGWVFMLGVLAGIALGISDAGPEISKAWSQLRGAMLYVRSD